MTVFPSLKSKKGKEVSFFKEKGRKTGLLWKYHIKSWQKFSRNKKNPKCPLVQLQPLAAKFKEAPFQADLPSPRDP